jgi:DNA-binding MarR family transcriptional regulator
MSFIRAKALVRLAAGPLTMRELAAKLATDPPYTSVVVDDLARRCLLTRSTHPEDRRVKVVSLTPAGAECAAIATEIQNRPPAVFAQLSAEDAATLDRILSSLIDNRSV